MVALIVVVTFVVLLLGLLVAGLLRSHADILRSLHELGVGVGDPADTSEQPSPRSAAPHIPTWSESSSTLGPAPTVAGVTAAGDARAIAVDNADGFTLLAFLSSGCATCAAFWDALQSPESLELPQGTRVAIVTKGPERELPTEVSRLATGRVPVVMSTEAWVEYEVPGSPFFVLVDGGSGAIVGQGVAPHVEQLLDLMRRAEHDRGTQHGSRRPLSARRNGPEREADADEVLALAGIRPGDASLYPQTLEDVFPFSVGTTAESNGGSAPRAE
ncbi:MAG TPA: hypothetical protein VGF51_04705 [Acidimicrobiales bacterium]